jgi:hypothetical protein
MPQPPSPPPDPLDSPLLQSKALLWLVVVVTVLFAIVLWPLAGAVSWAAFMAIVFSSLQDRSVLVCRGRKGWAAFGNPGGHRRQRAVADGAFDRVDLAGGGRILRALQVR